MGTIIYSNSLSTIQISDLHKPIIYCNPEKQFVDNAKSINYILAKKLALIRPNRRSMRLSNCFEEIIRELPEGVTIKDYDVMFNPEYKVDVLRIMVDVCKRKPFSLIWQGQYNNEKLIYAEEGFLDYKIYDIKDYDITCII